MYNTDIPQRADLPSSAQLLRSTGIAAAVAAALLVTMVLPAEYGIDPTGVGRALGLTQMGDVKKAQIAQATPGNAPAAKAQTAQPANASTPNSEAPTAPVPASTSASSGIAGAPATLSTAAAGAPQEHVTTITLANGQAAEVKLSMRKNAVVQFEWLTGGVPVNYDTHGDPVGAPKDFYHGYGKGSNKTGMQGDLVAAFDGIHGWYWRNRSGVAATITLKTKGSYSKLERVL
jgi:hypothetical protein